MPDPSPLPPRTAVTLALLLLAALLAFVLPARATAADPAVRPAPAASADPARAADRASPVDYVALGDSYSSGLGAGEEQDRACHRTSAAFPVVVASRLPGTTLRSVACAGATIPDVLGRQLGALTAGTTLVTITIGGNDAGFAKVLTRCALPMWVARCAPPVMRARSAIRAQIPARLDRLTREIRRRAPAATVVVVGYPRLFNGVDCGAATFFSPSDQRLLNGTADLLRDVLRSRAAAAGFAFADVVPAFRHHAVCDDDEWLNGLSTPLRESFHPDAAGHAEAYAPAVLSAITRGPATAMP